MTSRTFATCEVCKRTVIHVSDEDGILLTLDGETSLHGFYSLDLRDSVARKRDRRGVGLLRPHFEVCR